MSRVKAVCFDCADPWHLGHWWAPILGYRVRPHSKDDLEWLAASGFGGPEEDPTIALDPVSGNGPTIWFNRVPEPKKVKNRAHLDVYGDWREIVASGATVAHGPGEVSDHWVVLADPEGNEFCVFPASA